jgi:hypothetical protein
MTFSVTPTFQNFSLWLIQNKSNYILSKKKFFFTSIVKFFHYSNCGYNYLIGFHCWKIEVEKKYNNVPYNFHSVFKKNVVYLSYTKRITERKKKKEKKKKV